MLFTSHRLRQGRAPVSQISVEVLEDRRLLSASLVMPADTTSPVVAVSVSAKAGTKFKDVVGTWTTTAPLPAPHSATAAIAIVDWGDGKTTHAKLVDDGSGVIQIIGSHTWKKPGTFQTVVTVEEFPRKNRHQITDIGQSDGAAVVAPRPHNVSLKGTLTGTYTIPFGNPDARSYSFTGAGTARALGAATLTGAISPPGFIRTAPATGEFILTGATGSVTIDVMGKTQTGGSPLPQKLTYVVVSGTGDFANAGGKGKISLALDSTANTFVMVIH